MKPRVLIVGTVPYNKKSTSRAFESYFSGWERENLAQVFSNTKKPVKGHCETLFQITDKRMLKRRLFSKCETGIVYHYNDLDDEWTDTSLEVGNKIYSDMYKIGSFHTPTTHLVRKWVWKRKYWCTEKFNNWLDDFAPDCVFLSFSDDFFIPEIALYVAKKFNIPIISSIGDDYYFNTHFSISPFYYIYKLKYRKLIRKIFKHSGSAIYIGDKIRDKYNKEFNLNGETVYLTSDVQRKPFKEINTENPLICYFGNIGAGRNYSLNDIGTALGKINSEYILNVYSNETDERSISILRKNPHIKFHGSVPYTEVKRLNCESDIVVLVEGFSKKDIDKTRYSLSTKAADSLASGSNILVYGSNECGLIEYMYSTHAAAVCDDRKALKQTLENLLFNKEFQKNNYIVAKQISEQNHTIKESTKKFTGVVERVIRESLDAVKK